eukprot:gene28761-37760_t
MNYLNYYLALCITTICLGLTPLFIVELQPRIHDISASTLGNVLRTSVTIKVMVGISIGTTLPVMTDIVLDKISNISFVDLNNTVVVLLVLIICCLIMTVLPGRLLRKLSEINESVLQMKREFVRYLSHEIRSPLNVSHAGLEILKAELEVIGASLAILNLLELAVTPLLNVFAGRLEAYKYMATKKGINLRIEDLVQASEYYRGDDGADAEEKEGLIRQSTTASSLGRPPHYHKEATEPITKLLQEDNSLDKTCAGYLRFEVVDSGAGSIPSLTWPLFMVETWSDFHSDGEGLGSTFAVELPIYSRTTADRFEAPPDIESAVSVAPSSGPRTRPQPRPRATNVVQVLPASRTSEEGTSNGDTTIEIAAKKKKKLTVLIVDDSSANRPTAWT